MFKLFPQLLLFCSIFLIFSAKNLKNVQNYVHFKNLECLATPELIRTHVYPNFSCSISTLSGPITALNGYVVLRKPLNVLFVS